MANEQPIEQEINFLDKTIDEIFKNENNLFDAIEEFSNFEFQNMCLAVADSNGGITQNDFKYFDQLLKDLKNCKLLILADAFIYDFFLKK